MKGFGTERVGEATGTLHRPSMLQDRDFILCLNLNLLFHLRTGHEGPEGEQRYNSTLSLTSVLDVGGWSTPHPSRFTPGKETLYPLYRRLGGLQGRSGRLRKLSPPTEFDPPTFQPLASSYTDCGIPAPNLLFTVYYLLLILMFKELPRPQYLSWHIYEWTV
jgi:hypothetical protein